MTVEIRIGDCRDVLATLPEKSVHCCVTSPPYFGLRDYGVGGQMGLEATAEEFIAGMVAVFREVKRVLRDDGTLWLNIGDSYATRGGENQTPQSGDIFQRRERGKTVISKSRRMPRGEGRWGGGNVGSSGVKPKDLIGIPWMLAFALRADGWYLRQDIIWSKPNPMPESVNDRCTKAHEYLFLLSKSPRYYFDAGKIEEPRVSQGGQGVAGWAGQGTPHTALAHNRDKGNAKTFRGSQYTNNVKFDNSHRTPRDSVGNELATKDTRNKRSVWTIATQPFKQAHFATFAPALVEPCIRAGCPSGGTVLDPFGGAGTTGLVADRLQRNAILIELNPAYAAMARERIRQDCELFTDVT